MQGHINVAGTNHHLVDQGEGAPLLLIHGFPLDHTLWQGNLSMMSSSHRVIAPDLRGFGQTPPRAGTVTMEQFADDLRAILTVLEVKEPIALCGLSMGGYIAFAFQQRYPERVKAMVLCHTNPHADAPEAAQKRHALADRLLAEGHGPLIEAFLPKVLPADAAPSVVEKVRGMMEGTSLEGAAAALRGMAQRADVKPRLPLIQVPVLVVSGAKDPIAPPADVQEWAKLLPKGQHIELPGVGHLSCLEQPEPFNRAVVPFLQAL